MSIYIHPQALCESSQIGDGTRIWAFAHILPGAQIGKDCNICDNVFIENDVILGECVTVKCGVQLWDGLQVEDDVFIGPNATFSNDKYPFSKTHTRPPARTVLGKGSSIGANATILPGITIGRSALIGAGSVVTRDVPPYAIVAGNPARISGYVDSIRSENESTLPGGQCVVRQTNNLSVAGVTLHQFPSFEDLRGRLSVGNFPDDLPFKAQRFFLVYDVPSKYVRGEHAHKQCEQFLICVSGRLAVVVDDGVHREEISLDRPSVGLYIPPMVWATQYQYLENTVLLVFASHPYDADDYIRDYSQFRLIKGIPES